MKSVVIFKWGIDPRDLQVGRNGEVDRSQTKFWVGDDDHLAVQVACAAAGAEDEVVGLTMAGGDTAFAAARGAARTVAIEGVPVTADSLTVAKAFAKAVREIGDVEVVAIGDSAWDPAVPVLLAGLLGWKSVMAVDGVEKTQDGLKLVRRFGTTTQELLVSGPVVLGAAAKREEENKPGLRTVVSARKKPVETLRFDELAQEEPVYQLLGTQLPEKRASKVFDGADPAEAVERLLQTMRAEGVL